MRSIKVEALWGNDSKCLWCSRNIHVSSALQNPIGLAAFEQRQMNNQKGEERDPAREELWWEKKGKKRSSLCSAGSLKSFLQQTLVYTHVRTHTCTHTGTQPLSPPLPPFSCCLSLSSPSFISLHLYPQFAPGIPAIPQYLPLVCCPGFDIYSQKDQQHTLDPFLQLPRL